MEDLRSIELIPRHPSGWHPLTPEIRRCRLRRFPYGVVYTIESGEGHVLAIAHQHRKPGYWKDRLN